MPFSRPTLQELVNRTIADAQTRIGADELVRREDLQVLTRVLAGASHGLHGYIDWLSQQVIFDTAEAELLERWASIWGISRKAAAAAVGEVTLTGTSGTVVSLGTVLVRADGAEYETAAEVTLAAGTATAAVTALLAGQDGNAAAASTLTIATPIAGVNSTATVTAGAITGGADIETDDSLRDRFLARLRQPPHGGASFDYITWALEVAGVTRAWVYPAELGPGTVTLRFVRDADASPIPDAAEVAAVQNYIDALRPVTAQLTVVAPVAVPLNFTIELITDTAAIRAAVESELRDLLMRESEPGATILISHIREAISLAAGETDHILTVPAANVTHTTGRMATFGVITWV